MPPYSLVQKWSGGTARPAGLAARKVIPLSASRPRPCSPPSPKIDTPQLLYFSHEKDDQEQLIVPANTTTSRIMSSLASIFMVKRLSASEKRRHDIGAANDADDDKSAPLMGLSNNHSHDYKPTPKHRKYTRPFLLTCPAFISLILLSLLFGILATTLLAVTNPTIKRALVPAPKKLHKPCGSTPSEARKAGCHFDVISFCWLPDACYDAELSQQFDSENKLEWYLDPNRTLPLGHQEIMTGEYTGLYVNWEYHLRHCTAMWKKMHRAVLGGGGREAIDGYIGIYEHTEHCEMMLLGDRSIEWEAINTRIAVKFPDCGV